MNALSRKSLSRNVLSRRDAPARSVAWIESPLQLLSAFEAHWAGALADRTHVHPRAGVPGMTDVVRVLTELAPPGLAVHPFTAQIPSPRSPGNGQWVIGDMFSGAVQRQLVMQPPTADVVVLDDGLATRSLLAALASNRPEPLVRAGHGGPGRRLLGLATWAALRRLMRRGRLSVFTALDIDASIEHRFRSLGGRLGTHEFGWLRSQPISEMVPEPVIVVGSALPADGLIDVGPYVEWVHALTAIGPVAYYPHRRETADALYRIAGNPLVRVNSHTVPVEMRLRALRQGQQVHCLPSTVVSTLGLILSTASVELVAHRVPAHWWTPLATGPVRRHLDNTLDGVNA